MRDIKNRVAGLSEEQKKLLTQLLAKEKQQKANAEIVPQTKPDGIIPLSFAQERLWYLDQLIPGNAINNMAGYAKVKGNFKIDLAKKCFDEIVKRHETLRSTFIEVDGKPQIIIHPSVWDNHTSIDLRNTDSSDPLSTAHGLMLEDARIPFNLAKGPLVRFMWIQTDDSEWIVYIAWHHIISDGISTNVFFQDFIALYEPIVNNKVSNYAPLTIQYSDFALWQRDHFGQNLFKNQLNYWKGKLNGVPKLLELPLDHPRPDIQSPEGKRIQIQIDKTLTYQLKLLSQKEGVTLFVVLLSAIKVLLYRYTGQTDIVVGAPIAGRNRNELKNMIGCFLNMLVFRSEFTEDISYKELLPIVKKTTLEAFENQDIPFEKLVDELQIERNMSSNPLYQVGFSYEESPVKGVELSNLKLEFAELDIHTSKADLMFEIVNDGLELSGWLEYCSALFSDNKMVTMTEHLISILRQIVQEPEISISRINLLKESETNLLVHEWNNTQSEYPRDKTIQELFEAQAAKTPDSIALVYKDRQMTYAELNQRANQFARYLHEKGIRPDNIVGIMMERSFEMVIGIMGILKAGGAYLPIDPEYPIERIEYILSDSEAVTVLTQTRFLNKINFDNVIDLESEKPYFQKALENPERTNQPDNLAYIIYTSGSTGKPKGVMIKHSSVVNILTALQNEYPLLDADTYLLKTTFTFDVSVAELFGWFLAGGKLALLKPGEEKNPKDIVVAIQRHRVTHINFVPSMLKVFLDTLTESEISGLNQLKYLFIAGEALSATLVQKLIRVAKDVKLENIYGPTEITIYATRYSLSNVDELVNIPIGKPLPNVRAYILEWNNNLAPTGLPGELCISGEGLAVGYLKREELTAEKFTDNPFEPGSKMYRTGDMARWLPDGNIEYMGRIDQQVKIRGFRIELGEIENQLTCIEAVTEAAVVAKADGEGNKYLCAYFTADIPLTINELREYLSKNLPSYMLPSYFVQLPQMPLNRNGKIDRKALPSPKDIKMNSGVEYEASRNETEEKLAKIWQQFLKQEKIGIHDNYFTIGGDSILSIQIIAKARKENIFLQPRHFFEHQTIAELSKVAETGTQILSEQGIVTGEAPLTPIQYYFFEQNFKNINHWNQSVILEVKKPLDKTFLEQSFRKLIEHHDSLRLRFEKKNGKWAQRMIESESHEILQWINPNGTNPTSQLDAFSKAQKSLNIANGPLLKAVFINDLSKYRLFITIHHLAVDGVSWRILVEDLQEIYMAISKGEEVKLHPKTTSFKQYSEKLSKYASKYELIKETEYWKEFQNKNMGNIPVEIIGRKNTEGSVKKISIQIDEADTKTLLNDANTAYNTKINDLLLAALANALSNWTGHKKHAVLLESHGRHDTIKNIDLTSTVGWFTSIYPVVLSLPDDNSVDKLVKTVKETLHKVPENGFNYGVLKYLSNARCKNILNAIPNPGVSFNYLGQFDRHENNADLFSLKNENIGNTKGLDNIRNHQIDINAYVLNHKMHFDFEYSENINKAETVQEFANNYVQTLRSIIGHCTDKSAGSYTPSDFTEVELNQDELDNILKEIA